MCQNCVRLGIANPVNKKGGIATFNREKAAKKADAAANKADHKKR